jgi:hypothetical protein
MFIRRISSGERDRSGGGGGVTCKRDLTSSPSRATNIALKPSPESHCDTTSFPHKKAASNGISKSTRITMRVKVFLSLKKEARGFPALQSLPAGKPAGRLLIAFFIKILLPFVYIPLVCKYNLFDSQACLKSRYLYLKYLSIFKNSWKLWHFLRR